MVLTRLYITSSTLLEQWPSGQGTGFLIHGSHVQKPLGGSKVDSAFHPSEVGNLVVKSKLPLRSGSSLEAVELHQ